ncbi:Mpv17/PMP22 [Lasiodiplodia theobromae]|uniref:PXMP2/4 family protein 3 n=1 Tax=Lasiodiplodia theobromae TaxID=45133 RepID=A0A5N5DL08_9PEZI|nr:Mpv17/Pmp22 family protein [Lasiodiplodia theobromae]KAB2578589.1 PXMP2/4 family protein 3 [Lasiodiplodia theobromae]KAF4538591.1 Mpv17/Pmp22 family protein [Lasiodiplodia theobromae]KAF9640559.1 Mpv17/PMP22 [Lasiodiplodia theobromae]
MPSPMVNATLQAATLSSISNILAQVIDAYRGGRPLAFNPIEFLRFVILTLITAPPNYVWQQFLERTFPAYPGPAGLGHAHRSPRVSSDGDVEKRGDEGLLHVEEEKPKLNLKNTITKWFVDCITMGAIMNTVAFLVIMGLMKGQSSAQIGGNIRTETIPIIVAGYKIWPIASIISFSFIPVERRIVFLSAIGLCWGIYMSLVAARV